MRGGRTRAVTRARRLAGAVLLAGCCAAAAAADRAHTLNVLAWSDYFPASVVEKFQAQSGIRVNSAVMDSPEMAETALLAGSSNFDLVTMSAAPQLAREIPKGFWRPLDLAQIPNARNADPRLMQLLAGADPGNRHALPWMWGTVGILYDADRIRAAMPDAPLDSLDIVLRKDVVSRFAGCGVGMVDSWVDILPLVARHLGQPRLSAEPAALDAVVAKLLEIRPYIRRIASSGYYQQLAEGDLCLAIGYSGDAMIARRMVRESGGKARLEYSYAKEIVPLYVDALVIPADSPNAAAAQRFIDFLMRPDISAEVTRYIGFPSGNAAAVALLEPAIRDNAAIYPPPAVRQRMALPAAYSPEESRLFTRAWQRFKTGL